MPTSAPNELDIEQQRGADDLKENLGALSCFAAAELARLMRKPDVPIVYTRLLKERLESYIPKVEQGSRSLSDSNTIMAMALSLPDIHRDSQLEDVVTKAKDITDRLDSFLARPAAFLEPGNAQSLQSIVTFCITLSRRLRSIGYPVDIATYIHSRELWKDKKRGTD